MARYFAFGNIWLLVALAMFLGCKYARSNPDMVSFTEWGGWLYTSTYNTLEILCLVAATVCFVLTAVTRTSVAREQSVG